MIELSWDNDEKTIILGKFHKGWTVNDLIDVMKETHNLVESVEHNVYIMFDLLDAGNVPSGGISNFRSIATKLHPRIKMIIDVSDSMLVEALTNVFKSIYKEGSRVYVVKTFDEAYKLIESDMEKSAS